MRIRYVRHQPSGSGVDVGAGGAIRTAGATCAVDRHWNDMRAKSPTAYCYRTFDDLLFNRSRYTVTRRRRPSFAEQLRTWTAHTAARRAGVSSPHRPALHEYMSPEQLLQQLEEYESRRRQKDRRPDWLKALIEQVAELFDPLTDVARAGYDCRLDEHGWLIRMYLGTSEIIGGPKDGQIEHASFRLDIHRLLTVFESVERLEWYSVSNADREEFDGEIRSLLSMTATAEAGHRIQLELLGSPPRYVPSGVHLTDSGATIS